MEAIQLLGLLGAGLAAGAVNALAGGGSLVTFPALLAAGLPPITANVTNSVAVTPGYVASVLGSRAELRDIVARRGRRLVVGLSMAAVCGSAAGAVALLHTPARAFDLAVPFLVLTATLLLVAPERLRSKLSGKSGRPTALPFMVGLSATYGGYFGAALGVILVAMLSLFLAEHLTRITALKNVISTTIGLTTVVIFAAFGPVNWTAATVVGCAALAGGYLGARLARTVPVALLRTTIVVLGTAVSAVLLVAALA